MCKNPFSHNSCNLHTYNVCNQVNHRKMPIKGISHPYLLWIIRWVPSHQIFIFAPCWQIGWYHVRVHLFHTPYVSIQYLQISVVKYQCVQTDLEYKWGSLRHVINACLRMSEDMWCNLIRNNWRYCTGNVFTQDESNALRSQFASLPVRK